MPQTTRSAGTANSHVLGPKHTNLSLARIGSLIGKRTHATVLHSCSVVEDRLHVDKAFKSKMDEIEKLLKQR